MLPSSVRIIGLTASKCATQRTTPIVLRQFHSTTFNGEEKDTESPQEDAEQSSPAEEVEPVKLSRRRRKFHEWANGEGKKYKEPSQGTTNYIAQTPFPMNPLFKPVLPLSDAVREKIFQQYVSEPEKWTVRKLATEHNLSLARVDAILKLKAQEKQMMGEVRVKAIKFLFDCFGFPSNCLFYRVSHCKPNF